MDKKLLLTVQYECSKAGVTVPWDAVAETMGPKITGGAVVQHLAKLRNRMIEQGLSVPPPLKRGGGSTRISTSATTTPKAKATSKKTDVAQASAKSAKPKSAKPKAAKKGTQGSGDSEDEDDAWSNDDSDADYGQPRAKRAKSDVKGPMQRRVKTEDSDEEIPIPSKSLKRKHQSSKSARNLSTDIDEKPTGDYSDVDDDTNAEVFAAGAPWLTMTNEHSRTKTGKKNPYDKKSLVVSLPKTPYIYKTDMVGAAGDEEADDMADNESEEEVGGGGVENVMSTGEMNQEFSTSAHNEDFPMSFQNLEGHIPASDFTNDYSIVDNTFNGGMNDAYNQTSDFQQYNEQGAVLDNQGEAFDFDYGVNRDLSGNGGLATGAFGIEAGDVFGNNGDGLSFSNNHNDYQTIPYLIQTSWPTYDSSAGASYDTSVNQTPAGTSAGVDFGSGYFGSGDSNFNSFANDDNHFSGNNGADFSFNTGPFDGSFETNFSDNYHGDSAGGDSYGNEYYGN